MSKNSACKYSWLKYLLSGVLLGILIILVLGWGMSYTDSRPFCGGCHIMEQAALTQKMSVHANLSCNDCHAPKSLWKKIPFKAKEALKDVYMNMFGNTQLPILSGIGIKDVVNENCKECHTMSNTTVSSMAVKPYCVDCHRNVPHERMEPISTRMVGDE